jgi:hypothetical protein
MTEAEVIAVMGQPEMRSPPPAKPGLLWLHYWIGGDLQPITVTLFKTDSGYRTSGGDPCGLKPSS